MTYQQMNSLQHIKTQQKIFGLYPNIDYFAAKKLNDSVPYLGGQIIITSSWRPLSGAGARGSMHKKIPSIAFDFIPVKISLWAAYKILRDIGWKRIGINPAKNFLHVDTAIESGYMTHPYYFLESADGKDIGPLANQPKSRLQNIEGYGDILTITTMPGGVSKLNEVSPATPLLLSLLPFVFYFAIKAQEN